MNRSQLIDFLDHKQPHLARRDVEVAVKLMLEQLSETLASGDRIEIRGFGSFTLHHMPARTGRNPKTGEPVSIPGRHMPYFKPGKALRERVNLSANPISAS